MTVSGIMSHDVVTVAPDASLTEIRRRFDEGGFHHVIVLEEGELVGVISDRDLLQAMSPFLDSYTEEHRDIQTLAQTAEEIMRTEPITIDVDTTVEEASALLLDHEISSLPIVNGVQLKGIVTTKDLLEHYMSDG